MRISATGQACHDGEKAAAMQVINNPDDRHHDKQLALFFALRHY
ncbi:MAG: hypothetical protein V4463_24420 [Pseudomonadota bacterium]